MEVIGHEGDGVNQPPKLVHGPFHSVEERSFVSIVQENVASEVDPSLWTTGRGTSSDRARWDIEFGVGDRYLWRSSEGQLPPTVRTRQDLAARRHSLPVAAFLRSLTIGQQTPSEQVMPV